MGADYENARPSTYAFPESLRVDELLLRAPAEEDIDVIAPAFRDPAVGGRAGLPPLDAPRLREVLHGQLAWMRDRGLLAPYVIEDTDAGTILGGANLRLFDPMRDTVELGYWLVVEARGRGIATRAPFAPSSRTHTRAGSTASRRSSASATPLPNECSSGPASNARA